MIDPKRVKELRDEVGKCSWEKCTMSLKDIDEVISILDDYERARPLLEAAQKTRRKHSVIGMFVFNEGEAELFNAALEYRQSKDNK